MSWKNIIIEGYCLYDNAQNEKPACCKFEPGEMGVHCLTFSEQGKKMCPYFGFGTARSKIILTGDDGEEVESKSFVSDTVNEKEWIQEEKNWIKKWKDILSQK